jgi:Holliday junction DNA helicase RuvA
VIASLAGNVLFTENDAAVIEAAGIGFRVLLPRRTLAQLRPGQRAQCFTHLIVAQKTGELTLVGFESREELDLFMLLLGVSGVGPKAALSLVDALSPDVLRSAIAKEQPEVLQRVPGIGPKTSRRIIFDLKDRLGAIGAGATMVTSDDLELIEALTGLGYSLVEAQAAVQALPPGGSFEDRLRQALAQFAR